MTGVSDKKFSLIYESVNLSITDKIIININIVWVRNVERFSL